MIVLSILPGKAGPTSPPIISQVQILPSGIVTPYDCLLVRVNVTSDIGIAEVGIYFRIGPTGLSFNSTSEYEKELMYPILGNPKNGLWEYRFENQSAGTTIYFFIIAIDSAGVDSNWHNFRGPLDVTVLETPPSNLAVITFELNEILLNSRFPAANITARVQGYFPNFPEEYWMRLELASNRRPVTYFNVFEDGSRFWYVGQGSGIADIDGNLEDAPYDRYAMTLRVTIYNYKVQNWSYIDRQIPLYSNFPGSDMWDVFPQSQSFEHEGNNTLIYAQYVLARRVPRFYPPLFLLLTTLMVLGLNPLVSTYDRRHRFDLFLAATGLIVTALLSEKINPLYGLVSNVFEMLFAFLLVSTAILMAVSILSTRIRRISTRHLNPEAIFTLVIAGATAFVIISYTNLPLWMKLVSPVAGALGSILLYLSSTLRWSRRRAIAFLGSYS